MRQQLDTAIRLSLAGQVRNRFAWILLIVFVPVWYLVIGSMFGGHTSVAFRLRATGTTVVVNGHNLTLISAGLNSITLLTAFVVFAAVRRARFFDRRLVLSGYRAGPGGGRGCLRRHRPALLLAACRAVDDSGRIHAGGRHLRGAGPADRRAGPG